MPPKDNTTRCLYYPFARLLEESTLKYLLLVFDQVTFIDEAEDLTWRRELYSRMTERDHSLFSSFEEVVDIYGELEEEGIVCIVNPKDLATSTSLDVAIATMADITNPEFLSLASKPANFGLPSRSFETSDVALPTRASWQAFAGKLVSPLISDPLFVDDKVWASHLLKKPAGKKAVWSLSYEAGSAAVTNFYLDASEELNLVPVTTSSLHHQLVLHKLKRAFDQSQRIQILDDKDRRRLRSVLGHGELVHLFKGIFPVEGLSRVTFSQVKKFRLETAELRSGCLREIQDALRGIDKDPTSASYDAEVLRILRELEARFRATEGKLAAIRNKLFPAFVGAVLYGTAGGGAMATLMSYLGGLSPAGILTATMLTSVGAFAQKAIELASERKAALRSESRSVTYLIRSSDLISTS